MKQKLHIPSLPLKKYMNAMSVSIVVSTVIVVAAAALGRAVHNLHGALTEKPDIAIYLLLPDEDISSVVLLREEEGKRYYLTETKDGPKMITLAKDEEWYVEKIEPMHE